MITKNTLVKQFVTYLTEEDGELIKDGKNIYIRLKPTNANVVY